MQYESMDGTGVYFSYICCDPDRSQEVLDATRSIFDELENNGISEVELETAKNKMLSAIALRCEQPMGRLVSLGFNWVYNQRSQSVQEDIEAIQSVTLDDVSALVDQLNPGRFSMLSLGPK